MSAKREKISRLRLATQKLLLGLYLLLAMNLPAASYTLSEGFNAAENPSGPWGFGWKETLGGTYTLLTAPQASTTENGLTIPSWQFTDNQSPAVYANTTTEIAEFELGAANLAPGMVWVSSGAAPQNYCVIRFTVPAEGSGVYRVSTTAVPVYDNWMQGDTDYHVVVNGIEVFSQSLALQDSASFEDWIPLKAGDTVDFLTGRGNDGQASGSGLAIRAVVCPEDWPFIISQPQSQIVTNGIDVVLSTEAEGAGILHYQWFFNGEALPEATNSLLSLENVHSNQAGLYFVRVSNSTGITTSDLVRLTVITPYDPGIHYDLATGFTSLANPAGLWSFGWKETLTGAFTLLTAPENTTSENELPIPAWQFTSFKYPAIYANTNSETAILSGGTGHVPAGMVWFYPGQNGTPQNFGVIRFTIPRAGSGLYRIATTVAPVFNSESEQGDSDFHVVINGTEVFSQWMNPSDSAAYTNQMELKTGDTVDFLIGRGVDQEVNGSTLLISATVDPAASSGSPVILTQPVSQAVNAGSYVIFSAGAAGEMPLHYQWSFNNTVIPMATNSFLRIDAVQTNHAGAYAVLITNSTGSATSESATLTVTPGLPLPTYSLSTGFNAAQDPSAPWSFGWKETPGGEFNLLNVWRASTAENGVMIPVWELDFFYPPAVYANTIATRTATFHYGAGSAEPGTVWFTPGLNGEPQNFCAIRFTVPSEGAGQYQLNTAVAPFYPGDPQGDSDFHMVINGIEIFGQWLSSADSAACTNVITLNAGDTIDFLIGRGADQDSYGAVLKIVADLYLLKPAEPDWPERSAPKLSLSPSETDGPGLLKFTGATGVSYFVQASPDLVNWAPIGFATETLPGEFLLEVAKPETEGRRFFRVVAP